jgi:aminoglycoside/choline kinase family phosphotransferase
MYKVIPSFSSQPSRMSAPPIPWSDPQRERLFASWLERVAGEKQLRPATLRVASSDTSLRRYFRIDGPRESFVVMDAPPQHEDCGPYVRMARLLHGAGLHVPRIEAWDDLHGFMLLSDLGPTTYQDHMQERPDSVETLCREASEALVRLQQIGHQPWIPPYDAARLEMELAWFTEWYLGGHFALELDDTRRAGLREAYDALIRNALAQPQILVHRDWHCRNLMYASPNPGILDFQGAVWGPAAYDLVSLLRDAYIEWDEPFQRAQAREHWTRARAAGVAMPDSFEDFWRDFEWSGLQRQLKVLGFFARLSVRDGRHRYLADMPRVWGYAWRTSQRYAELAPLARLLEEINPTRHPVAVAVA